MVHLDVLAGMRWSRLVAVADPDPAALAAAAERCPSATAYGDWRGLLAGEDLDAVVVALPSALHAEPTIAALRAGAARLRREAARHHSRGRGRHRASLALCWSGWLCRSCGHGRVRLPLCRALPGPAGGARARGELSALRTTFCSAPRELAGWKRNRATGGGALLDLASHSVDTVRMVTGGEIAAVTASLASVRSEDDTAVLTLEVTGGLAGDRLVVSSTVSACAPQADRMSGTLTRLPLAPSPTRPERVRVGVRELRKAPWEVKARVLPGPEPSFASALRAFRTTALRGWPASPDLEDGRRCREPGAPAARRPA